MYPDRDYYRPAGFGGFSFFPPVIKNLLIINVIVFILDKFLGLLLIGGIPGNYLFSKYFALNPINGVEGIQSFYPWQLITYQFMHADIFHIFFNMFTLWMFGMEVENIWGSKKFLIFYLSCGVGGAVLQLVTQLLSGTSGPNVVGASGAIFGVMVAFAMMFPDRYIFIYFLIPVKAKYLITFFIIFEFFSTGNMDLVAHLVHIGGAATAFAYIIIDRRKSLSLSRFFNSLKKPAARSNNPDQFKRKFTTRKQNIEDADYYEINVNKKEEEITQEEIDRILDKISRSGYQNLTEKEKKILFEASKRN